MKVKEIITEAIYHTPEYALASREDQHKAFTSRVPDLTQDDYDFYKIEIPKVATIEINKKKVAVPVELTSYGQFKIVNPSKVPATKRGLIHNSPELSDFKKQYNKVMSQRREEFEKKLQIDIREKLPPAAKLALNDNLLGLINEKDYHAVHKWFEKNGFFTKGPGGEEQPIPPAEEFKNMNSLNGWTISAKEIGRSRGIDGRSMVIDWKNRCFTTEAWSSGD